MNVYLSSSKFKRIIPDWVLTIILFGLYCKVTQDLPPFQRQFDSTDYSISHPYTYSQRVNGSHLYFYAVAVPSLIIFLTSAFLVNLDHVRDRWHLIHVSLLGLWFALFLTCVITDILKCWIASPRPDFLERCGLTLTAPGLYSIDACSLPLGHAKLLDGLKSSPSGHLSLSFAGLGFLALWLGGQFGVVHSLRHCRTPIWRLFVCIGAPLGAATYIALSRVMDYRHHPIDVALGSVIGAVVAYMVYHRYFPSVFDVKSATPHKIEG